MTDQHGKRFPDRRDILGFAAGAAIAGTVAPLAAASAASTNDFRARKPVIIDGLGFLDNSNLRMIPPPDGMEKHPDMGIDARAIRDMKASGLSAVNTTLGYVAGDMEPFEHSVKTIGEWDAFVRRQPDDLLKVLTADDIRAANQSGKVGVIYGFQNAAMMGEDASRVEIFANLGVRVIQLTYNVRNQLGDGSMVPDNGGLTDFGREVVHALNENHVLVDLSHSGEQTCLDALATSKTPIAITHSGCRALADVPRNKTDEELKLLADKGGVVGIYFMPFLAVGRQPYAEDLLNHIEHAVNVCGEDHVGFGTDGTVPMIDDMDAFKAELAKEIAQRRAAGIGATGEVEGIVTLLPDLQGPDKFWNLADRLTKRGFNATQVKKITWRKFP